MFFSLTWLPGPYFVCCISVSIVAGQERRRGFVTWVRELHRVFFSFFLSLTYSMFVSSLERLSMFWVKAKLVCFVICRLEFSVRFLCARSLFLFRLLFIIATSFFECRKVVPHVLFFAHTTFVHFVSFVFCVPLDCVYLVMRSFCNFGERVFNSAQHDWWVWKWTMNVKLYERLGSVCRAHNVWYHSR